jgi:hypothetical protein
MHGVTIVEIGGETRTLSFNMHFMMFLSKELGCNPDEIEKSVIEVCALNPLRGVTFIIYCGILADYENRFILKHELTLSQVSKWVGDADFNSFTSVWNAFSDVMGIPKASQEQIDAYVAKNEKKKNSNPLKKKQTL